MWNSAEKCVQWEGCEPTLWEQLRQAAGSISMELVSLWDRDWVLYSMASHCCFQQTVHHYSVWQESKHCAFTWVKKKAAPQHLSLLSPFTASSCCFVSCLLTYVLVVSFCPFPFCPQQRCKFITDIQQQCNFIWGLHLHNQLPATSDPKKHIFKLINIYWDYSLFFSAIFRLGKIVIKGQTSLWLSEFLGCVLVSSNEEEILDF